MDVCSDEEEDWKAVNALKTAVQSPGDIPLLLREISSGRVRDVADAVLQDPSFYVGCVSVFSKACAAYDTARAEAVRVDPSRQESSLLDSPQWTSCRDGYQMLIALLKVPEFSESHADQKDGAGFTSSFMQWVVNRLCDISAYSGFPSSSSFSSSPSLSMPPPPSRLRQLAASGGGRISITGMPGRNTIISSGNQQYRNRQADKRIVRGPVELRLLQTLLHLLYKHFVVHRSVLRKALCSFVVKNGGTPKGMCVALALMAAIIKGCHTPIKARYSQLALTFALPLHEDRSMVNELTPSLRLYQAPLIYLLSQYIAKTGASGAAHVIAAVADYFPSFTSGQSKVQVRILHELQTLLESGLQTPANVTDSKLNVDLVDVTDSATFGALQVVAPKFFKIVSECLISDYSLLAQKALEILRSDGLLSACGSELAEESLFTMCIPALLGERSANLHWNKTVRAKRVGVVEILRERNSERFFRVACEQWLHAAPTTERSIVLSAVTRQLQKLLPEEKQEVNPLAEVLKTCVIPREKLGKVSHFSFVFGHLLGEGSYAEVRYAKHINVKVPSSLWDEYAIKIMSKSVLEANNYEQNLKRELKICESLNHPFITPIVASFEYNANVYFVLDFAKKGDLHGHLSRMGSFSEEVSRFVAAQILVGLEYLQSNGVVYSDLKPENVLVHESSHVKLTDFATAVKPGVAHLMSTRLEGTQEYFSPELVEWHNSVNKDTPNPPLSPASDLWAFGCVLYQMLAGHTPLWTTEDTAEEQKRLAESIVKFDIKEQGDFPDGFPCSARDLIVAILQANPAMRLGVNEQRNVDYNVIKAHPFFNGINWTDLHLQTAPEFVGGIQKPDQDKTWGRRKFSMMFAPLPAEIVLTGPSEYNLPALLEDEREADEVDQSGSLSQPLRRATYSSGAPRPPQRKRLLLGIHEDTSP